MRFTGRASELEHGQPELGVTSWAVIGHTQAGKRRRNEFLDRLGHWPGTGFDLSESLGPGSETSVACGRELDALPHSDSDVAKF